ncbi:HAMP domain-containing protein [Paenibacillus senegalensis]|uniref:HAMP domain-containing protein n=1 Tax=Paenibacillus senegalensis TaxID=1465766 RepID=UPI0002885388|nr:methyl-accepting chemotaxis protein [Paenibacillus senegalensis]
MNWKLSKVRSLQVKLTMMITLLMFAVIFLRTFVLELVGQYADDLWEMNLISAILGIVLSALGAFFIIRVLIKHPLQQLNGLAQSFSRNDYSQRVNLKTRDEFQQLGEAFNEVAQKIEMLLAELEKSSASISSQSKEVRTASYETQQTAEQVAISMEEMTLGSEQVQNEINSIVESANRMVGASSEVTGSIHTIKDSVVEVVQLVEDGSSSISTTDENVRKVLDGIEKTRN